jgi:hypothetical protein
MPHFLRRLKANNAFLNFYFNRIFTAEGVRFHVSVIDRKHQLHTLNLEEVDKRWRIVKPEACPLWLLEMEKTLAEEIINHLTELTDK